MSFASLIGFPTLMGIIAAHGVLSVVGMTAARRRSLRPARKLGDGQGYLLGHSVWEKLYPWSGLAVSVALVVTAFVGSGTVEGTLLILAFAGLHGFLMFKWIQKTQNEIEISEDGLVQRRGNFQKRVRWSDIQSIRESLSMGSVVFRGSEGEVRVDKLMDGLVTLFQFMQRKLPSRLFDLGLMCWGSASAAARSGIRIASDDEASSEL